MGADREQKNGFYYGKYAGIVNEDGVYSVYEVRRLNNRRK